MPVCADQLPHIDGAGTNGISLPLVFDPRIESRSFQDSHWEVGGIVGGGIETLLSNNYSFKLEYRRIFFPEGQAEIFDEDGTSANVKIHGATDEIRGVVTYKFQ